MLIDVSLVDEPASQCIRPIFRPPVDRPRFISHANANRLRFAAIEALLLTALSGCLHTAGPSWLHPGTAQSQQNRALRYDPYPENEPGPVMVGVRPREYQQPPPEPSRARWQLGNWGQ